MKKKINFKQPKYIFPLIALPFILFIGYQVIDLVSQEEEEQTQKEIATSLGKVETPIMGKNEAYDKLFQKEDGGRSMISDIEKENDSLLTYTDNMNEAQKRFLDSLEYEKQRQNKNASRNASIRENYYRPSEEKKSSEDQDFERSKEIIKMLNEAQNPPQTTEKEEVTYDPVKGLREQMLFLDSLEKSKDPEFQRRANAQRLLKENKEKMDAFLNKTLSVSKAKSIGNFNHISREGENYTIKAIIDENIKGYLGSRIRIRLLEDIAIGKYNVKKGTYLYAEISGFTLQRVNLNIVSVMVNNTILPINLTIYDMDGLKGLYVPSSTFREMTRELGSNSVQGMNMESGQGFFSSLASSLFRSVSESIVALIRKNKVTLKYSTHIYLINEKELEKEK